LHEENCASLAAVRDKLVGSRVYDLRRVPLNYPLRYAR